MAATAELPKPHRDQLGWHREIAETGSTVLLAVDLHKAKFHQQKALEEYQSDRPLSASLPEGVYPRSKKMVQARSEETATIAPEAAWSTIVEEETWVGSLPIQMYRETQDVYLRGFPYLIGFKQGEPRVILNKILPTDAGNMDRFYANEWARPLVIADILAATGFETENLIVATMKAKEPEDGRTNEDVVLPSVYRCARENVYELLDYGEQIEAEPWEPVEPELPHQASYIRTQVLDYRRDYAVFNRIGHGDSIRELVDVFLGDRVAKGTPPDRGLSLEYALGE